MRRSNSSPIDLRISRDFATTVATRTDDLLAAIDPAYNQQRADAQDARDRSNGLEQQTILPRGISLEMIHKYRGPTFNVAANRAAKYLLLHVMVKTDDHNPTVSRSFLRGFEYADQMHESIAQGFLKELQSVLDGTIKLPQYWPTKGSAPVRSFTIEQDPASLCVSAVGGGIYAFHTSFSYLDDHYRRQTKPRCLTIKGASHDFGGVDETAKPTLNSLVESVLQRPPFKGYELFEPPELERL